MERLMKALGALTGERYKGAYIARAIWQRQRRLPAAAKTRLIVERDTGKVLRISIRLEAGEEEAARLQVMLFLASGIAGGPDNKGALPDGDSWPSFSADAVADFVRRVGDGNPIHQTERPVVPGLLILERLQAECPDASQIGLRFLQPLYAGDEIRLVRRAGHWQGIGPAGPFFDAEIGYFIQPEE